MSPNKTVVREIPDKKPTPEKDDLIDPKFKQITITSHNTGQTWETKFEGSINRRDLNKLVTRVLRVEYAKIERQRSVAKLMESQKRQEAERKQKEAQNVSD